MPHELEAVAVKGVRSRLGHRIDGRAGGHSVPRITDTTLGSEFLQSIGKRNRAARVRLWLVVVTAVDEVLRAVAGAARDGDGNLSREAAVSGGDAAFDRTALKDQQLSRVATV